MTNQISEKLDNLETVYGPVNSWRYGRSLGIDPIGKISTCSFNCVYCQLGEIEDITSRRKIFIPTTKILQDLSKFAPWDADVITLSGSGEPTLALNLGEIIKGAKTMTNQLIAVLTNGTLFNDPEVRSDLSQADYVAIKLDAINADQWRRVNRPDASINLVEVLASFVTFRKEFSGKMAIQTMLLTNWSAREKQEYMELMQALRPDEIQLNTPSRPKPLQRQFDGRENHSSKFDRTYAVTQLKCLDQETLLNFAQNIQLATGIKVRYASP